MWHKPVWIGHPMRLELTREGLLVYLANHYTTWGTLFDSLYLFFQEFKTSFMIFFILTSFLFFFFFQDLISSFSFIHSFYFHWLVPFIYTVFIFVTFVCPSHIFFHSFLFRVISLSYFHSFILWLNSFFYFIDIFSISFIFTYFIQLLRHISFT